MKISKSIIALALAALVPAAAFAQSPSDVAMRQTNFRALKERMEANKELTGEECAEFISRNELTRIPNEHHSADNRLAFALLNWLYPTVAKWHEAQKLVLPNVPEESRERVNDQLYAQFRSDAVTFIRMLSGANSGWGGNGVLLGYYFDWLDVKLVKLDTPEAVKAAIEKKDELRMQRSVDFGGGAARMKDHLKTYQEAIQAKLASHYIKNPSATTSTLYEPHGTPIDKDTTMPPLGKLAPETLRLLLLSPPSEPPSLEEIIHVLIGVYDKDRAFSDAANRARLEAIVKKLGEVIKLMPEPPAPAEAPETVAPSQRRSDELLTPQTVEATYLQAILKELEDLREELKAERKARELADPNRRMRPAPRPSN